MEAMKFVIEMRSSISGVKYVTALSFVWSNNLAESVYTIGEHVNIAHMLLFYIPKMCILAYKYELFIY